MEKQIALFLFAFMYASLKSSLAPLPTFGVGLAIFLVSDYNSAFPTTVTALSHQSVAIGPFVCHSIDLLS